MSIWKPISEAKKDGTAYLLRITPACSKRIGWESEQLGFGAAGCVCFVGRCTADGGRWGWQFAARVGVGGFSDDDFEGFMPLTCISSMERCLDMLGDVPGEDLEAKLTKFIGCYLELQMLLNQEREACQAKWRSLKDEPPGPEHKSFFVGSSEGGRTDLVFRWPHPKTGKMAFWCQGDGRNYVLADYGPDVWYPAPPEIQGSWRSGFVATGDINANNS